MVQTVRVAAAANDTDASAAARRSVAFTLRSSSSRLEKKAGGKPPARSVRSYRASAQVRRELAAHVGASGDPARHGLRVLVLDVVGESADAYAAVDRGDRGARPVQAGIVAQGHRDPVGELGVFRCCAARLDRAALARDEIGMRLVIVNGDAL